MGQKVDVKRINVPKGIIFFYSDINSINMFNFFQRKVYGISV